MINYKQALTQLFCMSTLLASDNIEIYNHFGNSHKIIIEGRMLHSKNLPVATKDDNIFKNLWRKLNQLENNEIKNQQIFAYFQDKKYTTTGDDEGYFRFELNSDIELSQGYENIRLNIKDNKKNENIKVPIFTQKSIAIISDFDDTVIVSDVTNKLKLSNNLLLKNYKQRDLISGMKERFQNILSRNSISHPTPLFFVTGSPQQLFNSIEKFLNHHNFMEHVLITKQIHGQDKDSLLDQISYKLQHIEELIEFYPNFKWVLFGDSGEKDKEIYNSLSKKYPSKIEAFYIRDVDSGKIKRFEPSE